MPWSSKPLLTSTELASVYTNVSTSSILSQSSSNDGSGRYACEKSPANLQKAHQMTPKETH